MHELSIALSILDIAEEELARHGGRRAVAIHLPLGPLSGVVKEALLSAYQLAREGSPLEQTALQIEAVPLVIHCPKCAADREVSLPELCCPSCGGPPERVVTGREMEVVALE